MHDPSLFPLLVAEVPHGGEKEREAPLVAPDLGGLLRVFRHPKRVRIRVEIIEHGGMVVQLIPQYQNQVARAGHRVEIGSGHGFHRLNGWRMESLPRNGRDFTGSHRSSSSRCASTVT
jgi:hypothetical protein